ncbi:MAG: mevalonate kinase family protein, partial [Corynebacterium variabile]
HPAIAMPLRTLRMIARVEPTDGPGTLSGLGWTGPITEAPARFSSIVKAAEVASDFAGHPGAGLNISTESEFPPERGLGSSAAAAGAVIRAVLDAFDTPATPRELFDLTQEAETVAHGRPSGLDAVATSAEAPVHFQAGQATVLEFSPDAWIVIADSGVEGSTRETVGHVRARFEAEPDIITALLNRLGEITDEVVVDLRTGDVQGMGARMTEAHGILGQLGVSNTQLDALVTASLGAGALGRSSPAVDAVAASSPWQPPKRTPRTSRRHWWTPVPGEPGSMPPPPDRWPGRSCSDRCQQPGDRDSAREYRADQVLGQSRRRAHHPGDLIPVADPRCAVHDDDRPLRH